MHTHNSKTKSTHNRKYNQTNHLPNTVTLLVRLDSAYDILFVAGGSARITQDIVKDGATTRHDQIFVAQPTENQKLEVHSLKQEDNIRRVSVQLKASETTDAFESSEGCWAAISIRPSPVERKVEMVWAPLDHTWRTSQEAADRHRLPILGSALPFSINVQNLTQMFPAAWELTRAALQVVGKMSPDMLPHVPVEMTDTHLNFCVQTEVNLRKQREEKRLGDVRSFASRLDPEQQRMLLEVMLKKQQQPS